MPEESRCPIRVAYNNGPAGPATTLYFAAGPNDEANGLFGSITAN